MCFGVPQHIVCILLLQVTSTGHAAVGTGELWVVI